MSWYIVKKLLVVTVLKQLNDYILGGKENEFSRIYSDMWQVFPNHCNYYAGSSPFSRAGLFSMVKLLLLAHMVVIHSCPVGNWILANAAMTSPCLLLCGTNAVFGMPWTFLSITRRWLFSKWLAIALKIWDGWQFLTVSPPLYWSSAKYRSSFQIGVGHDAALGH